VNADLEFALSLADDADAITLARFRAADLRVETKPDLTPVSEADRLVEQTLRARIERERPGEAVLGEEEGGDASGWILDPIDGTKNFVRGIPIFATLISLQDRVAVVSAPALGRRWWASSGKGAYANGERVTVSRVARLEEAVVTFTSLHGIDDRYLALARRSWAPRGYGDFWQHMLVAEGAADVAYEQLAHVWDLAAPKLIVEEAGGRLSDIAGADRIDGGNALTSNGLLHEAALAAFR
jgi:histidinol-phosphatase